MDLVEDEFISEIEESIEGSFFQKDSMQLGYTLTSIEPIHNDNITISFNQKKNDLKKNCKRNNLIERDLFYVVYDRGEVEQVKLKGFECVRSDDIERNVLGISEKGIHFGKHLDLVLRNEYRKNTPEFYCILTKAVLNIEAICTVTVNLKTEPPKLGYQCLISNELADQNQEPTMQNLNTMMYIYDYSADGSINPKPKNILPHAILKYQLTNPSVHDCTIYKNPCHQQQQSSTKPENQEISLSFSFNESDTSASAAPPPLLAFSTESPALTEPEPVIQEKKPQMKKKFSFSNRAPLVEEEKQRSPACQLDRNFQPVQHKGELITSTGLSADSIQSYFKNELFYEKLPRWRKSYEKYGKKDIVFKSKFNLTARLVNIYAKINFLNEERTVVDLKDPLNSFLLPIKQPSQESTNKAAKPTVKSKKPDQSITKKEELSKSKKSDIIAKKSSSSVNSTKTTVVTSSLKESTNKTQSKSSTPNPKTATSTKTSTLTKTPKTIPSAKTKTSTPHGSSPLVKAALIPTQKPSKSAVGTPENRTKTIKSESKASGSSKSTPNAEDVGLSSEMTSLEKRLLGLDKAKSVAKTKAESSSKSNKFNSLSANLEKVSQKSNKTESVTSSASAKEKLKELETKESTAKAPASTATTVKPSLEMPKKPKNIQEELRKISAKLNQEKKSMRIGQDLSKTTVVNNSKSKDVSPMSKRKKSFWDPDSDTEYDRLVKKNNSASKKLKTKKSEADPKEEDEDNEESDSYNDEYVIVSKQHLNIQPVQYSKQYYDLNMNGLENELKRFSPCQNSSSPHSQSTVTKHIKAPITPNSSKPIKADSQPDRSGNRGQKFIHHYVTQTAHYRYQDYQRSKLSTAPTFTETVMSQFDVDSLKNLKRKSTSNIIRDANGLVDKQIDIMCYEIHAGGFRSIEDHHFQKSENYLRRTRSFSNQNRLPPNSPYDTKLNLNIDQSMSNDSYIETMSKHQRKISLNEYANIRARSSDISTPQPLSNFNSYPNSVNSGDVNVNDDNTNTTFKNEKIIKSPASINSPNRSYKNVCSPPDPTSSYLAPSHQNKSSLSLMDELKKRIDNTNKTLKEEHEQEASDNHNTINSNEYNEIENDYRRSMSESEDSSRCSKRKHVKSKSSKSEKQRRNKSYKSKSLKKKRHRSSKKHHSKHSRRSRQRRKSSGSDSSNSSCDSSYSEKSDDDDDSTSISTDSSLSTSSRTIDASDLSDGSLSDSVTDLSSSDLTRSTSRSSLSSHKRKSSKKKSHKSRSKNSKKRRKLSRDRSKHKARSRDHHKNKSRDLGSKSPDVSVKDDTYDDGECSDSQDNINDDGYSIDPDLEDNLKLLTSSQRSDMSMSRRNQTPEQNHSGSYKSIESTPRTTTSSNNSRSNTPMQLPIQQQFQQKREGKEKHPTRQFFTPNMAGKRVPNAAFVNTSLPPPITNFNGGFPPMGVMQNNAIPNDNSSGAGSGFHGSNSTPKFNRNQFNTNQKFNNNSGPLNNNISNLPVNNKSNQQPVCPSNFMGNNNNNNSFNEMKNNSLNNSASSNYPMNESFGPSNNSINNFYPNNSFDSSFNGNGQNMSMNYKADNNSNQSFHNKPQMQASANNFNNNNGNNSFKQSPVVTGNANFQKNKGNFNRNITNNNRMQQFNNSNMKNNQMMSSIGNMDPVAMQNFFNKFVQSMGPNFSSNMANFDPVTLQSMIMQFMSNNNIDASMFSGNNQNNFNNFNFNSPAFRNNFNKMFNNTGNNQFNNNFQGGNCSQDFNMNSGNGFNSNNNANNKPMYNDSPGFIPNNMNSHRPMNYNGNNNNMNNSFNAGNVNNNFNTPKNNNFQKNKGNKFNNNRNNNNTPNFNQNNNNRMAPKNSQPQNFNRGFNQQNQGQSGMMNPSLAPQQTATAPKPVPVDLEDGEID